jgi:hypothetical protein
MLCKFCLILGVFNKIYTNSSFSKSSAKDCSVSLDSKFQILDKLQDIFLDNYLLFVLLC